VHSKCTGRKRALCVREKDTDVFANSDVTLDRDRLPRAERRVEGLH
jgi:hypothetical protein